MHNSTPVFPAVPASLTGQALVSHAGLGVLTGLLNALGFRKLCEDRFSQFVPSTAVHRPGRILGTLAVMLAADGEQVTDVDQLHAAPGTVRCRRLGGDDQPVHGPRQGPA